MHIHLPSWVPTVVHPRVRSPLTAPPSPRRPPAQVSVSSPLRSEADTAYLQRCRVVFSQQSVPLAASTVPTRDGWACQVTPPHHPGVLWVFLVAPSPSAAVSAKIPLLVLPRVPRAVAARDELLSEGDLQRELVEDFASLLVVAYGGSSEEEELLLPPDMAPAKWIDAAHESLHQTFTELEWWACDQLLHDAHARAREKLASATNPSSSVPGPARGSDGGRPARRGAQRDVDGGRILQSLRRCPRSLGLLPLGGILGALLARLGIAGGWMAAVAVTVAVILGSWGLGLLTLSFQHGSSTELAAKDGVATDDFGANVPRLFRAARLSSGGDPSDVDSPLSAGNDSTRAQRTQ